MIATTMAWGAFGYHPADEMVSNSDLVVVAILQNVKLLDPATEGKGGFGDLTVTRVIVGAAPVPVTLDLRWRCLFTCPCMDHRDSEGKELVWFLQREQDGSVSAEHPFCVLDPGDTDRVARILRELRAAAVPPEMKAKYDAVVEFLGRR